VSCIGATWIGGGLVGTLRLMLPALKEGGLMLVGEPYWIDEPPQEAYAGIGVKAQDYTSLSGTFDRFESVGLNLVEMVLADQDSWDRYEAAHWWTMHEWLRGNPDDPDAPGVRDMLARSYREYLTYTRRYLGWGVFALKAKAASGLPSRHGYTAGSTRRPGKLSCPSEIHRLAGSMPCLEGCEEVDSNRQYRAYDNRDRERSGWPLDC